MPKVVLGIENSNKVYNAGFVKASELQSCYLKIRLKQILFTIKQENLTS